MRKHFFLKTGNDAEWFIIIIQGTLSPKTVRKMSGRDLGNSRQTLGWYYIGRREERMIGPLEMKSS